MYIPIGVLYNINNYEYETIASCTLYYMAKTNAEQCRLSSKINKESCK